MNVSKFRLFLAESHVDGIPDYGGNEGYLIRATVPMQPQMIQFPDDESRSSVREEIRDHNEIYQSRTLQNIHVGAMSVTAAREPWRR
jgi:hypothetical protein